MQNLSYILKHPLQVYSVMLMYGYDYPPTEENLSKCILAYSIDGQNAFLEDLLETIEQSYESNLVGSITQQGNWPSIEAGNVELAELINLNSSGLLTGDPFLKLWRMAGAVTKGTATHTEYLKLKKDILNIVDDAEIDALLTQAGAIPTMRTQENAGTTGEAPTYYAPQPKESWLQKNKKMLMLGAGLLVAAVAGWYFLVKKK
jgi:hypothetical protein